MANRIKAFAVYTPRVKMGPTVKGNELLDYIIGQSFLTKGVVHHVLYNLRDAIIGFNQSGRPVKVEGIGTFSPVLDKDGTLNVRFLADKQVKEELNIKQFSGEIKNEDMIGKPSEAYIERWNEEHPDDKIKESP